MTTLRPDEIEDEFAFELKEEMEREVADFVVGGARPAMAPAPMMKAKRAVARSEALHVTAEAKEVGRHLCYLRDCDPRHH